MLPATLFLFAALVASAHSSAIKGHQQLPAAADQPAVRTVKSLAGAAPEHKAQRIAAPVAVVQQQPFAAPSGPILESSRKVYNDESIRRSAVKAAAPIVEAAPVQQPAPAAAAAVAPVVASSQPVAPAAVVVQEQPAAPVQAVAVPAASQPVAAPVVVAAPVESSSKVEAKSVVVVEQVKPQAEQKVAEVVPAKAAAVEAPVAPVVVAAAAPAPAEQLPAQSDRSAPIKPAEEKPVVAVVAQPAAAPVAAEMAPEQKQQQQPQPIVAEPAKQQTPIVSELQAKKDEPIASSAPASVVVKEQPVAPVEPALQVELPAPDPGLVLSEPIDSTTKLLIDLDEHMQKFLPAEDKQEPVQPPKEQTLVHGVDYSAAPAEPSGKSALPVSSYSPTVSGGVDSAVDPIVPPMPSLEGVEKASSGSVIGGAQAAAAAGSMPVASGASATRQANHGPHQNQQQVITQLLDQLDSLQSRIQDTINQLVARRRYVMSALLRPMGTYVRRVRTNLERLQTRVNSLQAAAQSVGGGGNTSNGQNRPAGFVDAAAIETIRRRIDDISKRISDIVNRIRFSLTPTSAPMNSNGRKIEKKRE